MYGIVFDVSKHNIQSILLPDRQTLWGDSRHEDKNY